MFISQELVPFIFLIGFGFLPPGISALLHPNTQNHFPVDAAYYRYAAQRCNFTRAGTLISIHYFEVNFPAEEAGGGWFYYFPDIPVVPTVCLTISSLINLYGNRVGLMPLE